MNLKMLVVLIMVEVGCGLIYFLADTLNLIEFLWVFECFMGFSNISMNKFFLMEKIEIYSENSNHFFFSLSNMIFTVS